MSTSANPIQAKAPGTTVPMLSPDGNIGDVPIDKVHEAVSAGFKMGVDLIAPSGEHGTVPVDAAHNALSKGFRLARPAVTASMQPSYTAAAIQNSPTGADPHNPGNPNLNAVPQSERETVNDRALGAAAAETGSAGLTTLGSMLTAPRVVGAASVGTGILDASGQEIMRDVTKYGPSAARSILSNPIAQRLLIHAAGTAGAGAILKALGVFGK